MTNPLFTQTTFRIRNDDGSESAATWKANENTNATVDTGEVFRVRFRIDETASRAWTNKTWNLYYSKGGGAYTQVTTSSSNIRAVASANFADGDDCTSQLSGGTGTFVTDNNGMSEDGNATNSGSAGNLFEVEYALELQYADLADGNTIALRVYDSTSAINAYSNTPTITVNKVHRATATLAGTSSTTTVGTVIQTHSATATLAGTSSTTTAGTVSGVDTIHDFETGDLTGLTSSATAPTVTTGAAQHGTYGLNAPLVNGSDRWVKSTLGSTITGTFRTRFYYDLSGAALPSDFSSFMICQVSTSSAAVALELYVQRDNGSGGKSFWSYAYTNSSFEYKYHGALASDTGYVEIELVFGSSGTLKVYVGGSQLGTTLTLTNDQKDAAAVQYGCMGAPASSSGQVEIDDIAIRDSGSLIGALSTTDTFNLTATLAGTSSTTTAGNVALSITAALAGTSSLTADGSRSWAGTGAALAGTSSLTAEGQRSWSGATTLAGTSSLTADGLRALALVATLDGTSSLTAVGTAPSTYSVSATLAGTSSFTADGSRSWAGTSAALAGSSSLTAEGQRGWSGATTLAGTSSQAVDGSRSWAGTGAALAGSSSLTAEGQRSWSGATTLTGSSSLTAEGQRGWSGATTLAGTSSLTADGSISGQVDLTAALAGASSLAAEGLRALEINASLAGESSLSAAGVRTWAGTGSLDGTSSLAGAGTILHSATVTMAGTSMLSADGTGYTLMVALTVGERSQALRLTARETALSVEARTGTLSLSARSGALSVEDRSRALRLGDREIITQ